MPMHIDAINSLAKALDLNDAVKQRLVQVSTQADDFNALMHSLLSVKDTVSEKKRIITEYLRIKEEGVNDLVDFAVSQGANTGKINMILQQGHVVDAEYVSNVFRLTRAVKHLTVDVKAKKNGGKTLLDAEQTNAANASFEADYGMRISEKMLQLAIKEFGSADGQKVRDHIDSNIRTTLFTAVASGDPDTIKAALKTTRDTLAAKIVADTTITVKDKMLLPLKAGILCKAVAIGAVGIVTQYAHADIEMHEQILGAIMKNAPDETVISAIAADYTKLTTLEKPSSVKVRLLNGTVSVFYMQKGEEKEIPDEIRNPCKSKDPKTMSIVVDVDTLSDEDMKRSIAQMSKQETMTTKLVADLPGFGKAGQEIIIRGEPGYGFEYTIESIGGTKPNSTQHAAAKAAISATPMKYLHRDFTDNSPILKKP